MDETCLDFVVPGYVCLRKNRPDRPGGGCATFIRTGVIKLLSVTNDSFDVY